MFIITPSWAYGPSQEISFWKITKPPLDKHWPNPDSQPKYGIGVHRLGYDVAKTLLYFNDLEQANVWLSQMGLKVTDEGFRLHNNPNYGDNPVGK